MMQNYTSIEQSKELMELGLNPDTSDMWWLYITSQGKHIAMMQEEPDPHYLSRMESYGIKDAAIPCWSFGSLLSLIPNNPNFNIMVRLVNGDRTTWTFECQTVGKNKFEGNSDFDCCLEVIRYFLKFGYIQNFTISPKV